MNKKNITTFCYILIITCILGGCGKQQVVYQSGLPKEVSPGLTEFLQSQFTKFEDNIIIKENGSLVYADGLGSHQDEEVVYYESSSEQIEQYYFPLLNSENPQATLEELKKNVSEETSIRNPIDNILERGLPFIKMEKNNQLRIKLGSDEELLNLPSIVLNNQINESDEFIYNVVAWNNHGFIILIRNFTTKEDYYAFVKSGFSKMDIYHSSDLDELIKSGKITEYYSILPKVGETEAYLKVFNGGIFNPEDNEVVHKEKKDYRSEDWKYIYINGAEEKLADGMQKIQTIENYLEGNDIYETEFNISFKKIAKKAGIKMHGVSIAKIVYFNEDFVVLRLKYNGIIVGDAGATNVIIDLQGDPNNPTAYLVDLGIT